MHPAADDAGRHRNERQMEGDGQQGQMSGMPAKAVTRRCSNRRNISRSTNNNRSTSRNRITTTIRTARKASNGCAASAR